ncbi:MAG: chorismate mutase [Streptococcaceae bacterium]|nr:chorismate mutase [Streptococcaceae bacterium]
MELEELRQEMDKLNAKLLPILKKRFDLSKKIAIYKYKHNLPIYDEKRENKILEKIKQLVEGGEFSLEIMSTIIQLFENSKRIQNSVFDELSTKK